MCATLLCMNDCGRQPQCNACPSTWSQGALTQKRVLLSHDCELSVQACLMLLKPMLLRLLPFWLKTEAQTATTGLQKVFVPPGQPFCLSQGGEVQHSPRVSPLFWPLACAVRVCSLSRPGRESLLDRPLFAVTQTHRQKRPKKSS